ncbi:Bifunctional solanapyrone synthase [Cyphellophora attinorum]|uniref:Bifunctional solanapyrone synthase n=1 Tax=Cyphellophora attinorum TaxID=1664694 RepID=A0A0N1HB70_9EURO|nr:Bifunctional solanapyrone synthase [Phialophora attinorum]KPI40317.1 Bifunctional solanapyrone synthase [Phialophora attinorum]
MAVTTYSKLQHAGLEHILLQPSDGAYAARQGSYLAQNAALNPACVLQPRTAEDVSQVMRAIADTGINFAVRSGGCVLWPGGSSIADGVTIDLGAMGDVIYNSSTRIASLQPGSNWGEVYKEMEKHCVMVAGARDVAVGVGGFLTGGGNSYLTGRIGFACDTVVNFEVVLADSRIVNANATEHADLWKALKGGWSNVGIVTRFDVGTLPGNSIWAGSRVHDYSIIDKAAAALVKYTEQCHKAPQTAHLLVGGYNPNFPGGRAIVTVVADTEGNEAPQIFDEILSIPTVFENLGQTTIRAMAKQSGYSAETRRRAHWFTLTFANDIEIVKKAISLHEKLATDAKAIVGSDNFVTSMVFQPLPACFAEIGTRKGGNSMGLAAVKSNSIMWLLTMNFADPSLDESIYEACRGCEKDLEAFARSRGGDVPWRYINYADKSQHPWLSCGPELVDFLTEVSKKYDPQQVFQHQQPGSFTLLNARTANAHPMALTAATIEGA